MQILREKKVSSLNIFPGMNTSEIILLTTGGKMKLLKTITEEGTYSIPVEKEKPVLMTYQGGNNKVYNRLPVEFISGCNYFVEEELRIFGILSTVATGVSSYQVASVPSLVLIPTSTQLVIKIDTEKYSIAKLSTSGVKLHIFQ